MNLLRHDLRTSGWSMIDCGKWIDRFNHHWVDSPGLEYRYWHLLPQAVRDFTGEMDWLLHEALPEEKFKATYINCLSDWISPGWHRDLMYLRVLFSCRGEGTIIARSFGNNVTTPHGYALIMTGYERWRNPTWHTSPHNAHDRRLCVITFQ